MGAATDPLWLNAPRVQALPTLVDAHGDPLAHLVAVRVTARGSALC